MMAQGRWLLWSIGALATLWILAAARPPKAVGPYDFRLLGHVPVSAGGRVKPLDTVARNSLMILNGRQTFRLDGQRQPAMRWWVDLVARSDEARHYKVFRIDHPDVLAVIGRTSEDGKRFSYDAIYHHREAIAEQVQLARGVPSKQRTLYQKRLLKLSHHLAMCSRLSHLDTPYMVPPLNPGQSWRPMTAAREAFQATQKPHEALIFFEAMKMAYQQDKPEMFNRMAAQYLGLLEERVPRDVQKARIEVFFNHFQPFYRATILYVIAFLLGCVSFLLRCLAQRRWSDSLCRATIGLLLLTLCLHTFGLGLRMYLQGRPPVTNLYSSAVFIGWGCVLLALIMEWLYRLGLGTIVAGASGFVTLIIAHNLGTDGDTMEMMQAVLDTNFWLATHVVTVTTGYSATFLAGILAILFIVLGVFTPVLTKDLFKTLGKMVYGVVCFAAFLSFVGTVLGGIWADQSWGRFWGWDPKENGAVLIVLMNMLILHARWGGMIQERGMMVLAVAGNIVTSWSWFGTNMLGVGLHAYGFMDSAFFWLLVFVASQLLLMGVGLIPLSQWRSLSHWRRAAVPS